MRRFHCTVKKQTNQGLSFCTAKSAALTYPQHGVTQLKIVVPVLSVNHSLKLNNSITGPNVIELLEKWQTLLVAIATAAGVLVMAFLYMRFPSRREFNKYKEQSQQQVSQVKTDVQKQLTAHKNELQEQLKSVEKSVTDDVQELEKRLDKVPTIEDLHELELNLERLNTNIESVKPGLQHVEKLTALLMENELREKRNGSN